MNEKMQEISKKYMELLMDDAGERAGVSLLSNGTVPPMLFFHGVNGMKTYSPDYMPDERSKDEFVDNARILCIAHGADAAVFLAEAWINVPRPVEALNFSKPISRCAERQEAIIILGQTLGTCQQLILPMQCCEKGKYVRPGEGHKIEAKSITGRFSNILPFKITDARERKLAQDILDKRGVKTDEQIYREEERAHRMCWRL